MLGTITKKKTEPAASPIVRLREQMDDLFGRFFGLDWPWDGGQAGFWPELDVTDNLDSVVVKADLPGMKSEDIDISIMGNVLTISGERNEVHQNEAENAYHYERRTGAFRRDLTLPAGVLADKIEAQYRDGVLTLTMPKSEQAKAKRIPVKT